MKRPQNLAEAIERVVLQHLAAERKGALAAMERAFGVAGGVRVVPEQRRQQMAPRRTEVEMGELAERLDSAVRARPGQTMAVVAAQLGMPASALHRPMVHLKRAGKVRSAGQRHQSRYFPMNPVVSGPQTQTETAPARAPPRPRSTP